ncbi:(2Fe-2S)-binding protein [Brevibacillus sp. NRS-1366]|uniref:(2Fe-2S)-binding protein n=1 Tax=Brevibacillus sp. NRS-1366 TaxID=3233899 RepID=UPI003D24E1A7
MSQIDFQQLEQHFQITVEANKNPLVSIKARELIKPQNMEWLVQTYAPMIKAKEVTAAGTFFCGWLGGLALGYQYMLSVSNGSLNLGLDQLTIELYRDGDYSKFAFLCQDIQPNMAPLDEPQRGSWRERQLRDFYQNTLQPLIQSIAAATGNSPGALWGQLPTRFNYYMDIFMRTLTDPVSKERLEDDYRFLKEGFEGEIFGLNKNPFRVKVRWTRDLREPDKNVRLKNQCCLYYQTEGGQYCYTCPRLKESDRAQRRKQA